MQTSKAALILALAFGCQKQETATEAMARTRGTLIDQVNPVGEGAPYYSQQTLNPTWDSAATIVRMPPMQFVDHNQQKRDEKVFEGKTSIVAFVFTSCSGFCPFVVQRLKKVTFPNLQYVLITVDPEFDTPERLKQYAGAHGIDRNQWLLLTGDPIRIQSLVKETFASQLLERKTSSGRDFVHAGHFYVIDARGQLRGILNGTEIDVAQKATPLFQKLSRSF